MGFLDFIFDNLFIVLIIAFAIINLFSRMAKGNQNQERERQARPERTQTQQSQPRRENAPSPEESKGSVLGRMAESVESAFEEISGQFEEEKPQETIAEQQQKQYAQLKKDVQNEHASYDNAESHKALKRPETKEKTDHSSSQIGDIDLGHLITRKGLTEGVIMSEVLGPPRALKPYRSVIEERRR